jgi:dCMP deaminase
MGIAILASKRSKDPRTQNGACIVNKRNRVLSIGYNGFPDDCSDDEFSWEREDKHKYIIHAELNAILNAPKKLKGCRLYLYSERGYYPCDTVCAQAITQKKMKEVILNSVGENVKSKYDGEATKKMFEAAGIKLRILE